MKSAKKRHHIKGILLERFLNDAVACAFERQSKRISLPRSTNFVGKAKEICGTHYNLNDHDKDGEEDNSKDQHLLESKPSLSLSGFLSKIKKSDPQVVVLRKRKQPSVEALFEEDMFAGSSNVERIEGSDHQIDHDQMENEAPKSQASNEETRSIHITDHQENIPAIEPFSFFSEDSLESMMGPRYANYLDHSQTCS